MLMLLTWVLLVINLKAARALVDSELNCAVAEEAQNASVTLAWSSFEGDVNYTRISHCSEALVAAGASLPDRLLILGGIEYESAQPVVDSPVLVYNAAANAFLKPQDQVLSAVSAEYQSTLETVFVSPASRAEHASFVNQDGAVFMFGGRSREFVNDTWRGCVDASSANVVWDELVAATDAATTAAAPVPRVGHSFTKVFENSSTIGALVFGGLSEDYAELNGLHLALIAKPSSSSPPCTNRSPKLAWRMLRAGPLMDAGPVPTARAYHAAMTVTKLFSAAKLACLVVHGGKSTLEGVIFNELWRLCPPSAAPSSVPVERMNYTWELLAEIGTTPGARYGSSMAFVDEGKLALAGGSYRFPSDFLSDTWELNVNATQWIRLSFAEDYAPPRRGHTLSFFSSATRLFLFGGRDRYAVVKKRMQAAYYGAPFCAPGLKITFCPATSTYVCIACPAGSYLESGSRRCLLCPQGTFSSAGSAECTKCPTGSFSTDTGKDSSAPCTSCPAGTFSQALGAVSSAACNVCAPGSFTASPGSVSCSSCDAGTFSSTNASTCTVCPRGKWSAVGAGTCTDCAAGTYAPSSGSTACFSCPRGYISSTGDVLCSACPVNTHSASVGASACPECPAFAFTSSAGQSECQFCPSGSSWDGSACLACSKGYYAANGACVACPKGSYASEPGSSGCQSCPPGRFTSTSGATNASDCQVCPSGSFLNGADCQACGAGSYPEPSGFCSSCAPGSFFSGGATLSSLDTSLGCGSCPSMSYSSGLGATGCSVCAENSFSMEAWRSCISCTAAQLACVTGRNGLLCSGNGACVYGGCSCNAGWGGGDCSVPVDDTTTTTAPAVLYFPDAPLQLVNASASSTASAVSVKVARSGALSSRLDAVVTWSSSNFSASSSSLPATLEFAAGEALKTLQIPMAQLAPRTGCRFFALALSDVSGASTSAVSTDPDNAVTVYVDDGNGVSGGVAGRSTSVTYERQANGTSLAAVALDRLVATRVSLSPQTTVLGASLRDQPLNLLLAIDFAAPWASAFVDLLPAVVAQLQIVYRAVPDGLRLGLLNGTSKPAAVFYSHLVDFFDAVQELATKESAALDWERIASGLQATSASWPALDRRHLLIVAGDALVAGGSVALPSTLLGQFQAQNIFALTLSPAPVAFASGSDVMKSVAFGATAAIPSALRQAFEQKDSALPSSVNVLHDPAGLVSSAQATDFSSGPSSLPVLRLEMKSLPASAQLEAVTVGVAGGSWISVAVSEPGPACFPPTEALAVDSLPLSGWADAWHLSTLSDVKRLWKSPSTVAMALRQDASLLRQASSTILVISDPASTRLSVARTFSGSFFAAGLALASRGYWRSRSDRATAVCSTRIAMTGANQSLESSITAPFSAQMPGEWNYVYSQGAIPWGLSSLTLALECNTSSPGVEVEWAALGLLPDPEFACKCPRGFYHDALSDASACVRCAAGSYCAAGIKRQCPSGTFSFGKAASCEACRDGWICTDGLARLCDPGTYSTPAFTCGICPSGYACRNGKKAACPAGAFSPERSSECQSCPPGSISRSEGASTCELCPLGWTSNYQRNHCIPCPAGEATLYAGQHPCSSCAKASFPTRNQPEVCLA